MIKHPHKTHNYAARPAWRIGIASLLGIAALAFGVRHIGAAEKPVIVAPPTIDEPKSSSSQETAVLAGGCFWGVQAVFQHVKGVSQALSGYAGGAAATAHYDEVSTGTTGHAESVKITYDPSQITYGQLLQIYFSVAHDPTQRNRQGPDTGPQYRSTIFAANPEQREIAQAYIAQLNKSGAYSKQLATTVEDLKGFYPAENYHQDYLVHNMRSPYIVINDLPKIDNLSKVFGDRYRDKPVLSGM